MLDIAEVRDMVAAALGVAPESIGDTDDLVSLGMHSMMLMQLSAQWRKRGCEIRSSALALEPTLAAWTALLTAGATENATAGTESAQGAAPDAASEFGLATMQHAYWMGRRQDQALGGVAAHLYVEFDGSGLDSERLRRAVTRLVRRHEQLRASFTDNGTQRTLPEPQRPVFESRTLTADSETAELERIRQAKSHQRMDVAAGQVIDITLSELPGGRHRLHVDVDMLAADAQSYRRILEDLATLYEADADTLPPPAYTFREYLAAKERTAPDNSADRHWWGERLNVLPDIPALPVLPEAERRDPAASVRLHHWFDADAKARLHRAAHGHGVTPAVALATVFSEAIARWSARQRFLLNVPLFNREPLHADIDAVVGDFTNSVLVDVDAGRRESMVARAKRLQRELHTCAAHSVYEGLDVLRDLGRLRGAPVTPSVVFTSGLDLGELFSERVLRTFGDPAWIISQGPQVDLDAQVVELNGGLLVNWDIRRDALPAGVAEAMFTEFRRLLDTLVEPGADWNAELAIALPAEQQAARDRVNATSLDLGGPRTLHEAFFTLAQLHPERPALRWLDPAAAPSSRNTATGVLGYGELAAQALAIGHALSEAGVRPGDTVAVMIPKGHRQIPAVLGVLAAGATYLPISITQPRARRDRILARGGARVVLVDAPVELPASVTALALADAVAGPRLDAPIVAPADSIAYVLFTSGSTGEPKGVEVSHRAAANTIDAIITHFELDADDHTLGLSALEFDLSVFDIFAPLSLGGAVVAVEAGIERDAVAWSALLAETGVTVVNCAPGLITMLLDTAAPEQLRTVRVVITGGDRVKSAQGHRFRQVVPGVRFAGLGGTTETAIHSTICEITDAYPADRANVPYGVPLANVRCRVVNSRGEDCPDWVPGELWIGGVSVADGYRGDAERTADRFVTVAGIRWYRTGDLARYLPDGTLDFLGRADHQVKIRGFRVELGEVESALAAQPGIREAVALVTDSGRLAAVAAVEDASQSGGVASSAEVILAGVRELLPAHMLPEILELATAIPLTGNGKLDRAAIHRLVAAGDDAAQDSYTAPETPLEAAVEYIAAQVLGIEKLGVTTDFFAAGGDSILATTLTAKLRGLLAVHGFGVTAVLEGRTVRGITAVLLAGEPTPDRLDQVARILLELAEVALPEPVAAR
ncbi:amino acid adenylation domain-containing protein [Nocardia yunnanensis]|uniref:Phenyloxazoline synthase MbtB n=1 Tax=Nocardia yunnanensis TaxID=2382165 RepID=A0A386ZIR4_9NOCA|nr:non-ribosomal peptide synthetase [Nocardia yunnanensis]AYF77123.1 amino acid adenylation domain-containing protein [Nocardia yunnanensis]